MRIAIDCRLPFYQRGGISQYTLHLIPALAQLDPDNRYFIYHMGKDRDNYTPATDNFSRVNAITPCHHRLERWALSGEIATRTPFLDLLHSPDFIPPQFGAKHKVITVHDLNFHYFPQFLTDESLRYYRDQIRYAVDTAAHISADSEQTRQDLIDILNVDPAKITTVYLSVNEAYQVTVPEPDVIETLHRYDLPRGFILAVGTLEPRKNLSMLFEAYKQLREEKKIDVPLVLVGRRGWLIEDLDDKIDALGLKSFIRHLEGVDNHALARLYRAAGVLVTPSHYEGFGLPALEALNCGCPIIVSDRGSLPEIAGDAGVVIPPDSAALWADQIESVLTDSERRQGMIHRGYSHASTFSWSKAARKTLAIYRQVTS